MMVAASQSRGVPYDCASKYRRRRRRIRASEERAIIVIMLHDRGVKL